MFAIQAISRRSTAFAILAMVTTTAYAHPGHGNSGLADGLTHPFGLDHLLAMVAVGIWSGAALPANKTWWRPLTFLIALTCGAVVGVSGGSLPYLEQMIALSVALIGAMLVLVRFKLPAFAGLALVAAAASLHGLAHGVEAPQDGFGAYAAGFSLTTAALHVGGVMTCQNLQKHVSHKAGSITRLIGLVFGSAGLYMFSQL